ncbi:MAG: hypothetical protein GWO20_10250 [Candidatus Korarchaeota archaeon]|nr:hypothetical protein [Candidatus Korarchaeota archaeon]
MKKLLTILLILLVTVGAMAAECKGNAFLTGKNEERVTFLELGIETFNVSLGDQEREASFDSNVNGSASVAVSMFYTLEEGDTPNVDIYVNDNHTEADLRPNETEYTFRLNTTVEDNIYFKLRADVPYAVYTSLTLTIFHNSTIVLKETGEDANADDGDGTHGNDPLVLPLTNSQLKVLLALSIIIPLLFGIWAEKIFRKATRETGREDGEEVEVIV